MLIALDNIDEVIKIIRGSKSVQDAKSSLIERFGLTEAQAQAIVDMRLRALTGLEREKLEAEYKELMDKISYLKSILADEKKLLGVIKEELLVIAQKYGDERRTVFSRDVDDITDEELIEKRKYRYCYDEVWLYQAYAGRTFQGTEQRRKRNPGYADD